MNFFKHHIGDYDADTSHLTWLEDMAYTRLMRLYYRREQPIPADVAQACRLVRAVSKVERQAVAAVLSEFFILGDDGWRNKRCDEEIAHAEVKADANRSNGAKGGRPKKVRNPTETQSVSQECKSNNPPGFSSDSEKNLSQTPDTSNQTPDPKKAPGPAFVLPDWIPGDVWAAWMPIRKAKRAANTPFALDLIVKDLARWRAAGHDPAAILQASIRGGWSDVYEPKSGGWSGGKPSKNDRTAAARTMFGTNEAEVIDV